MHRHHQISLIIKISLIIVILIILCILYYIYNPDNCKFFPSCPVYVLTGFKCTGCGSQRAIHYLLNGNIVKALSENALIIIAIPYIIFSFFLEHKHILSSRLLKIRYILYGRTAILIILSIIIIFTILRNIFKTF